MKISKELATRVIIKCAREYQPYQAGICSRVRLPSRHALIARLLPERLFALFGYGENRSADCVPNFGQVM